MKIERLNYSEVTTVRFRPLDSIRPIVRLEKWQDGSRLISWTSAEIQKPDDARKMAEAILAAVEEAKK